MFSGLPRTADIGERDWHVSVVPQPNIPWVFQCTDAPDRREWRSCEPHGFDDRLRERAFPLGEPEHDIVMVGAWHWHEEDRAAARHGRGHVGFTLPLELVGLTRRVGDDERNGALRHVQQWGERRDIGGTEL